MKISAGTIDAILSRYTDGGADLIGILLDIQREYRYLPREALVMVANKMALPLTRVYSVVTFYSALRLTPPGTHDIKVCCGSACHHKGSERLMSFFARKYDLAPGQTTADGQFSLETVECLGACAAAPAIMVDETYYGCQEASTTANLLKPYEKTTQEPE